MLGRYERMSLSVGRASNGMSTLETRGSRLDAGSPAQPRLALQERHAGRTSSLELPDAVALKGAPRSAGCGAGFTITELLIASSLGVLVILWIAAIDSARSRMEADFIRRGKTGSEQPATALALMDIAKSIQRADRINILGTGVPGIPPVGAAGQANVQLRIPVLVADNAGAGCTGCTVVGAAPPACCFEIAANYRWDQYRVIGTELRRYTGGCGSMKVMARQVGALTFMFRHEAQDPPLSAPPVNPAGADNNVLEFAITWDNGLPPPNHHTREFRTEATSREIPYSNVNAAGGLSGSGLSTPGISDPPAGCT